MSALTEKLIEKGMQHAQRQIARGLTSVNLRDDKALTAGSNPGPLTQETRSLLGVEPMRIYKDSLFGIFPSHRAIEEGLLDTKEQTRLSFVDNRDEANVVFVLGNYTENLPGVSKYKNEFSRGTSGVTIPHAIKEGSNVSTQKVWEMQGHGFAQYGLFPEIDDEGNLVAIWPTSMEGAYHRSDVTTERGFLPIAERLNMIAATQKVTTREYDTEMTQEEWTNSQAAQEVIDACRKLREWGLMPPIELESVTTPNRTREIMLFLNVAGLSTGNASAWEKGEGRMRITASGVDKGNLDREKVLPVTGFSKDFDGVHISLPKGVKQYKTSVEAFDNYLNFMVSLGIDTGHIKSANLNEILAFAQDTELTQKLLEDNDPSYERQTHFHAHPVAWDSDSFAVVEVNSDLTAYGNANSSCGTRPLAYYTAEMMARGILENPGKIIIAKLPKHGSQVFSPFDYETTVRLMNPTHMRSRVVFAPVDMQERDLP